MLLIFAVSTFFGLPQEDPSALLREALQTSAKRGGVRITGRVSEETPFRDLGMRLPGLDVAARGKFSGVVGPKGTVRLKWVQEEAVEEIFKRGARIVRRRTWTGSSGSSSSFPSEVTSFSTPSRLSMVQDRMKEIRFEAKKTVEGVECHVIRARLPMELILKTSPARGDQELVFQMFVRKKLEGVFFISVGDRSLKKLECTVTRGFSLSSLQMKKEGTGRTTPKAFDDLLGKNFVRSYSILFTGYGKVPDVEIPGEIQKYMKE